MSERSTIGKCSKRSLAAPFRRRYWSSPQSGVFCGAIGKSAQFPLHVWLPDAMEGPTPVSALIHAATMVAAGVYLVARSMDLFVGSADAALVVATIGLITSFLAASIALIQNDIKRVLAYSTVSQLGYMIMALGLYGYDTANGHHSPGYYAGTFHLMTHAFFKGLLFLGAGSVIHAVHTNDIQEMGGLLKKMPRTGWTFLIASASIAGIFPLAGFWSKDEIVAATVRSSGLHGIHSVDRVHDGVLHVAALLPDVLRRAARPSSVRTRPRVPEQHDLAADVSGGAFGLRRLGGYTSG